MEKDMFTINKNGFSYPASRKELWENICEIRLIVL